MFSPIIAEILKPIYMQICFEDAVRKIIYEIKHLFIFTKFLFCFGTSDVVIYSLKTTI